MFSDGGDNLAEWLGLLAWPLLATLALVWAFTWAVTAGGDL